MSRWKRDPYGLVVRLLICAVCAAITSRAGATPPMGRTVRLAREAAPLSFGTATTSDASVVAWVAQRRDGTTALKAAWIPWHGSVAGKVMVVAKGVGDLPPEPVARDDGRVWVVYADGNATPPGPPYQRSIRARILSAEGPVGDTPVTLALPDGVVYEFHAAARPDGGLLLWWWHQDQDDTNHVSTRAFDSEGNPLADERELLGGDYSLVAVADEGGALRVSFGESSEQGRYFQYLAGAQFDSDGAFLRGMELTPRSFPPVSSLEDFDVSRAAGGGYWLTWREAREGVKLWARRVTADGDLGPALVAGAHPAAGPLAPTPDGGFLVCHVSHGRLVARLHGEDARPRGRPLLLARDATSWYPLPLQLAVTATGRGAVAWWGPPATDYSRALFLTRFTVSPGE